jgi:hypothetical protein
MVLYMKEIGFSVEICLGYHCCGCGEYITGEGVLRLEDEQVDRLVTLIRENNGETDMETLGLEAKCPDIYEALEEAYSDAVRVASYRYWLINGFVCGYYEEPDNLMPSLEEAGLFHYDPDPADLEGLEEDEINWAKEDAFHEWLDSYFDSLSEDDQVLFLEKYYEDVVTDADPGCYSYEMEIPRGIIDLVSPSFE